MARRQLYTYDAQGVPVPVPPGAYETFLRWLTERDHTVAFDHVGGVVVSTLFVGIDCATKGPPILWETAVRVRGNTKRVRGYSSLPEALRGHQVVVAAVTTARASTPPPDPAI